MNFLKPNYLSEISEEFLEYFDEKNFVSRPYPSNLIEANKYLLFDVFNADKIKNFSVKNAKNGETAEVTYPANYTFAFDYDYWDNLSIENKVVLLYWWFKDECKKQNVYDCSFCFCGQNSFFKSASSNGKFVKNDNFSYMTINPFLLRCPSYLVLSTISHELNHCSFLQQEHTNWLEKDFILSNCYCPSKKPGDFFYETYAYLLYFFQPLEISAMKYGFNSALNLFKENASKKEPNEKDVISVEYIKSRRANQRLLKNIIFENDFDEHLDLVYLNYTFKRDAVKIRDDENLTQLEMREKLREVRKNIEDTNFLIQLDLIKFRKRFLDYMKSNKVYDMEKEKELDFD